MRNWIEPIDDRAPIDIENKTSKAYLNADDLNRIENNVAYLSEQLNALYYRHHTSSKTDWDCSGVPRVSDLQRICDNIGALVAAYRSPDGYREISEIPEKNLTYEDVNNLEFDLLGIKKIIDMLKASFKKSGTFQSGHNTDTSGNKCELNTKSFLPKLKEE